MSVLVRKSTILTLVVVACFGLSYCGITNSVNGTNRCESVSRKIDQISKSNQEFGCYQKYHEAMVHYKFGNRKFGLSQMKKLEGDLLQLAELWHQYELSSRLLENYLVADDYEHILKFLDRISVTWIHHELVAESLTFLTNNRVDLKSEEQRRELVDFVIAIHEQGLRDKDSFCFHQSISSLAAKCLIEYGLYDDALGLAQNMERDLEKQELASHLKNYFELSNDEGRVEVIREIEKGAIDITGNEYAHERRIVEIKLKIAVALLSSIKESRLQDLKRIGKELESVPDEKLQKWVQERIAFETGQSKNADSEVLCFDDHVRENSFKYTMRERFEMLDRLSMNLGQSPSKDELDRALDTIEQIGFADLQAKFLAEMKMVYCEGDAINHVNRERKASR